MSSIKTPLTVSPHEYIGDVTGRPLDFGAIWFGEPDKDPEFYPIDVFADEALTIPIAQPIRTKGGFINVNGDIIEVFGYPALYSVKVLDQYGRKIFYKDRVMRNNAADDIINQIDAAIKQSKDDGVEYAKNAVQNAIDSTVLPDGVTTDSVVVATPKYSNSVPRTQANKNAETITVKDFGAVGDGVADDTTAIQDAIDKAAEIKKAGGFDINVVTCAVHVPYGMYKTTRNLRVHPGVFLYGAGSGSTQIQVYHDGIGIVIEPAPDAWAANIHVKSMRVTNFNDSTQPTSVGIKQKRTIRNCYMFDVVVEDFYDNFQFEQTWTNKVEQCMGLRAKRHNIYAGEETGGLHIYGGRYDAAGDHSIVMNSLTGELILHDVATQFARGAGVYVEDCYTTELNQVFVEGNCIDRTDVHHIHINPKSKNNLSSATVNNCVINNLAQNNRNGAGILFVDNIKSFTYKERWVRNGVSTVPKVGDNVDYVDVSLNNAADRQNLINSNTGAVVKIQQLARPHAVFGRDMSEVSFSPTTYAAMNVGKSEVGVAIGTNNNSGAIQGYGDSYKLNLNPLGGDVNLGQSNAYVKANTNTFYGTFAESSQVSSSNIVANATTGLVCINAANGGRSVDLKNVTPSFGRRMTVAKTDDTSNPVTVLSSNNVTIDNNTDLTISSKKAVNLVGINNEWLICN